MKSEEKEINNSEKEEQNSGEESQEEAKKDTKNDLALNKTKQQPTKSEKKVTVEDKRKDSSSNKKDQKEKQETKKDTYTNTQKQTATKKETKSEPTSKPKAEEKPQPKSEPNETQKKTEKSESRQETKQVQRTTVKSEPKQESKKEVKPEPKQTSAEPLDKTTEFQNEVLRLVNVEREKHGLSKLTANSALNNAALKRAGELQQSFSHNRPDGSSFGTVLKQFNVAYSSAGENIAMNYQSPQAVVDGWMNSPGHRANILNERFNQLGVGVANSNQNYYDWVQIFVGN